MEKKDQVHTFTCLQPIIILEKETVHINPVILFNMLTMSIQREEERLNFFKYEHVKLHYYSRTVKCAKQIKLSFEIEYYNST